jgi:hypothetical protein
MPVPTVIRFEATEVEADLLSGGVALLTMQTKEGRIAVHMTRPVFVGQFREMQHALDQEPEPDQTRSRP